MFKAIGMILLAILAVAGSEFLASVNPVYDNMRVPFIFIVSALFFLSQFMRDLAPKGG